MSETQNHGFGKHLISDFGFREGLCHLNQGSYGTLPNHVRDAMYRYRAKIEELPDQFYRIDYAEKLMDVRKQVASLVGVADANDIAFVTNATTGTNTVLRSLDFGQGGGILHFSTVYPSCGQTIEFVVDQSHDKVFSYEIELNYPQSDKHVLEAFEDALRNVPGIKLAVFDTIVSLPGMLLPWPQLIQLCRKYNIFSLVDGAHGIGHIDLDLEKADPDFFVSNCHKWLHCARPSAILYVPKPNQHLIHSMPIGYGYISGKYRRENGARTPPAGAGKTPFLFEFEAHSTVDYTPFLAIKDALSYRESIGGEVKVREYCTKLAEAGGKLVAEILGTEIMSGAPICMVNIRLPIDTKADAAIMSASQRVKTLITTCMSDYNLVCNPFLYNGAWWVRLSAQVFNDIADFKYAGEVLVGICDKLKHKEQAGT